MNENRYDLLEQAPKSTTIIVKRIKIITHLTLCKHTLNEIRWMS